MSEHGCRNVSGMNHGMYSKHARAMETAKIRHVAASTASKTGVNRSRISKDAAEAETAGDRWNRYATRHGLSDNSAYAMIEWHGDDGNVDGTSEGDATESGRGPAMDCPDTQDDMLTMSEGGEYLGISGAALKRIILKEDVPPDGRKPGKYGNVVSLYSIATLERIAELPSYAKEVERRITHERERCERQVVTDEEIDDARKRVAERVHVSVRQRASVPYQAVLYVGPTNSGKSYQAIERLVADYERDPDGLYVYAGPLRMLAYEVYGKLCARLGNDEVGFVTGEEQINQDAHVRCCTVEMAPMTGTSLVLDEAHWMTDPDRGQYWTNLLVGGEYDNFYVISAEEAEKAVSSLLSDAMSHEIRHCERLTPLEYAGEIMMSEMPPRTAVVAFSRRGVYDVARAINRNTGLRCGVLYGALPLDVRREQIERFVNGEYDVMATTDVIGHGINLPIDNVVFAQTDKFDGTSHRDLRLWEAAQIAGRAGRYGMTDIGRVYALEGGISHGTRMSCKTELVRQAALAACGKIRTDLAVDNALVTPRFPDLGIDNPQEMMLALDEWSKLANERLEGTGIAAAPMRERRRLLSAMASFAGAPLWPWARAAYDWVLSPELTWSLSGAPLNPDGDALYHIVSWASDDDPSTSPWLQEYFDTIESCVDGAINGYATAPEERAASLERAYASLEQLKMIDVVCGTLGTLDVGDVEELIDRVSVGIGQAVGDASKPATSNGGRHRQRRRSRRKVA